MDGGRNNTQGQQGADERIEFSLLPAGYRNVKAAKAVLEDHGGDAFTLFSPIVPKSDTR